MTSFTGQSAAQQWIANQSKAKTPVATTPNYLAAQQQWLRQQAAQQATQRNPGHDFGASPSPVAQTQLPTQADLMQAIARSKGQNVAFWAQPQKPISYAQQAGNGAGTQVKSPQVNNPINPAAPTWGRYGYGAGAPTNQWNWGTGVQGQASQLPTFNGGVPDVMPIPNALKAGVHAVAGDFTGAGQYAGAGNGWNYKPDNTNQGASLDDIMHESAVMSLANSLFGQPLADTSGGDWNGAQTPDFYLGGGSGYYGQNQQMPSWFSRLLQWNVNKE